MSTAFGRVRKSGDTAKRDRVNALFGQARRVERGMLNQLS
jgi:hypothetical protein